MLAITKGAVHDLRSSSRSEERRVGKECRSRWSAHHYKKKETGPRQRGRMLDRAVQQRVRLQRLADQRLGVRQAEAVQLPFLDQPLLVGGGGAFAFDTHRMGSQLYSSMSRSDLSSAIVAGSDSLPCLIIAMAYQPRASATKPNTAVMISKIFQPSASQAR